MPLSTLPPRWRLILVLSLSLNLLLVGLGAGYLLNGSGMRDGSRDRAEPLVGALPDGLREDIRRSLPVPDRRARRARFLSLLDALHSDPFDEDRVRDLLSQQRRFGTERAARIEEAIIARLAAMSAAERAAYADRLLSRVQRGRAQR